MIDYIIKRPMLACALIGSLICIAGAYSETLLIVFGAIILAGIIVLLINRIKPVLILSMLMLLAIVLSMLFTLEKISVANTADGRTVTGKFIVVEEPVNSNDYGQTVLQTEKSDMLKRGTKIFVFYETEHLKLGQKISSEIKLNSLEDSKYKLSNYSEKIYLSGNMKNITYITGDEDFVLAGVRKIRNYITDTLFDNLHLNEASTLNALVSGDMTFISDDFNENIKRSGVAHVMVVSGMHLTIIVMLFVTITEKYLYNKFLRSLIIFAVVVAMAAICGFSMSILRAGITYLLGAFAVLINRENNPVNSLGAAVTLILISSPFTIFSVSFQLSVLSTFGILAVALPITKFIHDGNYIKFRPLYAIISACIVTVSASLLTLPVIIKVFGYISTVSLITNLLISTAVTFALSASVIGLFVNLLIPGLAKPFFLASGLATKYINHVINKLGEPDFAVINVGEWAAILATLLIVAVFVVLLACKRRNDMLKLKSIRKKIIKEGGGKLKWQ